MDARAVEELKRPRGELSAVKSEPDGGRGSPCPARHGPTAITAITAIIAITAITGITALLSLVFVIALLVLGVLIVLSVPIASCCYHC